VPISPADNKASAAAAPVWQLESAVKSASNAWTLEPIATPNAVRASAALVDAVPPFATGRAPVTSAARSTPPAFMVTAPELTAKLSELKEAIPFADVVASL